MGIMGTSSFLTLCLFVLVTIVNIAQTRGLSLEEPVLRLVSEEQCGPKLTIETPACKVEKKGDGFELRRYPAGQIWAETVVANSSYTVSTSVGFYRCFYFISGQNSQKESIEMTGPVLIKPVPSASGWKISFFTPSKFKKVEEVPVPSNPDVQIVLTKEQLVAVSDVFGGFPGEVGYYKQWLKLKAELDTAGIKYDESSVVYAGYSSPFEIFNRKQEVHVTVVKP